MHHFVRQPHDSGSDSSSPVRKRRGSVWRTAVVCGIAGIINAPGAAEAVARMTDCMAHRGPDDSGLRRLTDAGGNVVGALGHRRLSILDLSEAGSQPMVRSERFVLVLNGEIYNFRELRRELEAAGVAFASQSDTEVILAGWERHGPEFIVRLRGMFAIAIWDQRSGRGWLARDQFGIKPLYFASRSGSLIFASELRAVLSSGLVAKVLDPAAVSSYLQWGSVAEPATMVRGVRALEPGTVIEVQVRGGELSVGMPHRFAQPFVPHVGPLERSPGRARAMVREALRDSVAHHLISDVPVGLFLSGGIDSSAVVALAAEVSAGKALDTFTVTFAEARFNEASFARAVSKRFGTRHHEVPLSRTDLLEALPAAFASLDQPTLDGVNTYVVSRAVRQQGIKVVLSGLGGDEIFAGYPSFSRAARLTGVWKHSGILRRVAAAVAGNGGTRTAKVAMMMREDDPALAAYLASRALFAGPRLRALGGTEGGTAVPHPPPGLPVLQRVSWYELTGYMRNTLLRDSDVFSMAHHLELRVPFVDREVAAAAAGIDDSLKLRKGVTKPLLVDALGDLLPPEVWDRPKQGFTLPFDEWMRTSLREDVHLTLNDARRVERVGLRAEGVAEAWQAFLAGTSGVTWSRPWALYTLVRWAEESGLESDASPVAP